MCVPLQDSLKLQDVLDNFIVMIVEVFIDNTPETGLGKPSKILLSYPRTIRKKRLKESVLFGKVSPKIMKQVKKA